MLGGLPRAALHAQVLAALQVVLQVRRTARGRVLESISVLTPTEERLTTVVPAWQRGRGAGPGAGPLARLLAERGAGVPGWSA
jgi:pilus assembly protein CpaF